MNMQNVKDLAITEGDVRTIHDSNGNLLWGRLAYDTKYAGDTFQQTYTGKNQFDINTLAKGDITVVDGVATGTAGQFYTRFQNGITLTNTSPVMSITATAYRDGESSSGNGMIFRAVYTDTTFDNILTFPNSTTSATTLTGSTDNTKTLDKIVLIYGSGGSTVWHISNVQVEAGSTPTAYEPYVGGIPAPNPDYPQDVNVVTGEQTVTLSDGVNSHNYTVNLGSIELCKIDNYQDYIYKSGDDWYVHKELGKYTFDGNETITYNASNHGFIIRTTDLPSYLPNLANPPMVGLSTHFKVNTTTSTWVSDNTIGLSSTSTFWCKATSFATSQQNCTTWLTNNTPTIYYGFATPTDTKITDDTLIAQLNAIHEWLTRYGYNSSVIGNLPLLIEQTNLS